MGIKSNNAKGGLNIAPAMLLSFFLRLASAAHGSSQARGQISAAAAYTTVTASWDLSFTCDMWQLVAMSDP